MVYPTRSVEIIAKLSSRSRILFVASLGLLLLQGPAWAQVTLPYNTRRLSFSGLGTTVHGDIRTVGMGGASAGLADTFIASLDNPAGLAMTVGVGDINFSGSTFQDEHVQGFNTELITRTYGVAVGFYPWAVSVGFVSPYQEQAKYVLPSQLARDGSSLLLGMVTREMVISAGRLLLHDHLSIGVSLTLAQATRTITAPDELGGNHSYSSYTAGVTVGAMVQLPRRFLLGMSFSSPMHFGGADEETPKALPLPGFFQPVEVPWRATFGAGFIPNRYFRADVTLRLFTTTPNTALIRNEAARVGDNITLTPHLGLAYVFADYKELKATLFLGTYYEWSRIADTANRFHGTGGVEARLWIFTVGGGVDIADSYRSYLLSVGVDVFGVLARLAVIPPFGTTPAHRMFPNPWSWSDEGLARPLVAHWKPGGEVDPVAVGIAMPKNLETGVRNLRTELRKIGRDVADFIRESNETEEERAARIRKESAQQRR